MASSLSAFRAQEPCTRSSLSIWPSSIMGKIVGFSRLWERPAEEPPLSSARPACRGTRTGAHGPHTTHVGERRKQAVSPQCVVSAIAKGNDRQKNDSAIFKFADPFPKVSVRSQRAHCESKMSVTSLFAFFFLLGVSACLCLFLKKHIVKAKCPLLLFSRSFSPRNECVPFLEKIRKAEEVNHIPCPTQIVANAQALISTDFVRSQEGDTMASLFLYVIAFFVKRRNR